MKQIQTDAIRKLTEAKVKTFQNKRDFLVPHLREALCGFVEQDEDFAAAVMAEGKSLEGCVNDLKVPQGSHVSMSPYDAYRMAVQYFFPEADVELSVKISKPTKKQTSAKILNLRPSDLFAAWTRPRDVKMTDVGAAPDDGRSMIAPTKDGDG
ncbi:MAG: hypothetical protein E7585_01840 [Ruminococcaceae bacterium]|nr:hypothetical protein [Oscillospiraceae bacterium]